MRVSPPNTLVDVLHERAARHGERPLYRQLADGDVVAELSYAQADRRARSLAVELLQHASPGDRVLLLYPFGLEYTVAFFACLYAGLSAVPAFPPDKGRAVKTMPRVSAIIRDANARLIATTAELAPTVEFARSEAADPEALDILATDSLVTTDERAQAWRRPDQLERALAFLQYTSGSTGAPRGVMVGHDNLYAHQRLAHQKFRQPEAGITVSWLPFYHDMGLIGSLLYPLYHGGTTLLMSPTAFLRRPMAWLETISSFGARVSTAPNFAYDLCVKRSKDEDLERLDLSTWELTVSGAEPLRAATLERFTSRFARCGFEAKTFMPCFGMAEATLMVSGWPLELPPKIVSFEVDALRRGQAVFAKAGQRSRRYVSCGTPLAEHELAIVDPETRERLPEGREGEIWLRGSSVGRGYWGAPDLSTARFQAELIESAEGRDSDPNPGHRWFRTTDTGFMVEGELYGSGRLADIILVDGHRYQPHDIERSVAEGDAALVPDCAVFLTRSADGSPTTCLVATGRRTSKDPVRIELCERIHERVLREHSLDLDLIVLVPQRSIARTTSGKPRRFRYRQALRDGELERLWERPRSD